MLSRDHNILWLPESNGYPTIDQIKKPQYYRDIAEVLRRV